MNPIGIYVHHHGDGHRQRALSIARQAPEDFTLIGSNLADHCEGVSYLDLSDDKLENGHEAFQSNLHEALHYAPSFHEGIRKRNQQISSWIEQKKPAFIVVDVSVEVALLAQLCSTPFVYTRLSGNRTDQPHEMIFKAAIKVFCPFHERLESPHTPDWLKSKSVYFSGIAASVTPAPTKPNTLLVVLGKGGHDVTLEQMCALALNLNHWSIEVIGPMPSHNNLPRNLIIHGWVPNPTQHIAQCEVIAGACGDGLLSDVMALGKPFIALPQKRPYDEQLHKAQQLARLNIAVMCESWPVDWQKTVKRARQLGNKIADYHDAAGPQKAADYLLALGNDLQESIKLQSHRMAL